MDVFRTTGSSPFNGSNLDNIMQSQPQLQPQIISQQPTSLSTVFRSEKISGCTSMNLSATAEVSVDDEKRLEEVRRTLLLLDDIARGRHIIDWQELMDPSQPVESARRVSEALARPTTLSNAVASVAECITTPSHLSIVACLELPFRLRVRDAVLQGLLNALTAPLGPHPMPVCSEMMAEMVRLNLVVLRGVASTLETLLSDASTRRAGIAVLGRLADQNRGDEVFLRAVQNVEPLLRDIRDPAYDYDCVTISRLLGWGGADRAVTLVPVKTMEQSCTVTAMTYFRQRDELLSATCDGNVVGWGGPQGGTGDNIRPALTTELPMNCVPIGMDGPPRGNYLVIAGMPFHAANVQAMMNESYNNNNTMNNNGGIGGRSDSGSSNNTNNMNNINNMNNKKRSAPVKGPILRFLTCNESTGAWTNGETMSRKENVTLTAVAALANLVVCTAESGPAEWSSDVGIQHDLVLLNGHNNAQPLRRFEKAHDDYITVLRVGEDSDHILISGARDCVVKVWDTRSGNNRPGLTTAAAVVSASTNNNNNSTRIPATPTHRLENSHTDTITSLLPHRKAILTGALDGSLLVWDSRRLSAPVHELRMQSPILDITAVDSGHIAVSTARGLTLLSLDSLKTQDVVSNVAYTQLRANYDGSVLFAAGGSGIHVYGLRK